ncbi:hypothetical protein EP7_005525 (plasmid) [Isosphaeraceae bacterium EP7]
MIHRTFEARDELEDAAMEQARAIVRELKQLADTTPDGRVLAVVERGRRFLRDRLNAQAADLEKKEDADGTAPSAGSAAITAGPNVA